MSKLTFLHDIHVADNAKMVDFGGWDMPLHYGSQVDEHHQVRNDAGMFDVSHMTVVDINGPQASHFLSHLLANDINKLKTKGQAIYGCMLNQSGGVIDDLITYYLDDNSYRIIVNASTRDKDMIWIEQHAAAFSVEVSERVDLAMIAVQGPTARERFFTLIKDQQQRDAADQLKRFSAATIGQYFVARTGYTGEDGFEILVSGYEIEELWLRLKKAGVKPCGLGARDTLRLEAGMNLYGQDMDETTHPLESALAWTVAFSDSKRNFIGKSALERIKQEGVSYQLVGLVLQGRGVLRHGQKVLTDDGDGVITSGSFSPTLGKSIALARIPARVLDKVQVDIRGKLQAATIVKPPFVRNGKACDGID